MIRFNPVSWESYRYFSWCIPVQKWISVSVRVSSIGVVVLAIFLLLRKTFSYGFEAGIVNATTLLLTWMKL